ncbi:MAG: hypothetical protein K2X66_01745 [Cyanobacteria bacterium]|nr:hypothetical protein [Cyanobacteriota bacterium]
MMSEALKEEKLKSVSKGFMIGLIVHVVVGIPLFLFLYSQKYDLGFLQFIGGFLVYMLPVAGYYLIDDKITNHRMISLGVLLAILFPVTFLIALFPIVQNISVIKKRFETEAFLKGFQLSLFVELCLVVLGCLGISIKLNQGFSIIVVYSFFPILMTQLIIVISVIAIVCAIIYFKANPKRWSLFCGILAAQVTLFAFCICYILCLRWAPILMM